jgi:hypothetical protein
MRKIAHSQAQKSAFTEKLRILNAPGRAPTLNPPHGRPSHALGLVYEKVWERDHAGLLDNGFAPDGFLL